MAPRKQKKRAQRKRRSAPGGPSGKALHFPGTLIPQHITTTLKYVTTLQKTFPLLGKVGLFNQFRLNSIWDPDETSTITGTSALGILEYARLFQRYRVYRCDYKISMTNLSEDTIITGAVTPANYPDTSFSVSDYMRPLAKRFELGNRSGTNKMVVKGSVFLPKLLGVTSVQYKTDPNNYAGFTQNPNQILDLVIVGNCSNGGIAGAMAAQIELTYHVEMMASVPATEALNHATGSAVVPEAIYCTTSGSGLS